MIAKPLDLYSLAKPELKNLLANAQRLGRDDVATTVIQELTRRGQANAADYASLRWNQDAARSALEPFRLIATGVPDNQRTTYTEAGGMKIGRKRSDPGWMWVDSYSAIKTPKVNTYFVCYISAPGDDAHFELSVNGVIERRYEPEALAEALVRWRELAEEARL